MSKKDKIKQFL